MRRVDLNIAFDCRLPLPATKERGEGWGEGLRIRIRCLHEHLPPMNPGNIEHPMNFPLSPERLLTLALSSFWGGEGDGSRGFKMRLSAVIPPRRWLAAN